MRYSFSNNNLSAEQDDLDSSFHSSTNNNFQARDRTGSVAGSNQDSVDRRSMASGNRQSRESLSHHAFSKQDRKLEKMMSKKEFSVSNRSLRERSSITNDTMTNLVSDKSIDSSSNLFSRLNKLMSPVFCDDPYYLRWTALIAFLSVISIYYTPYRLAFESSSDYTQSDYFKVSLAIDIFFCFNLFLHSVHIIPVSLFSEFQETSNELNKNIITNSCLQLISNISWFFYINRRYLILIRFITSIRSFFDFISSVPWDFIAYSISNGNLNTQVAFALGSLRLLRILLVMDSFSNAEKNVAYTYFYIRLAKFLFLFTLDSHWFACIYYFIAVNENNQNTTWLVNAETSKLSGFPTTPADRYLLSLYWSVTTMATVGYGDITSQSNPEYILCIFYMLFNLFLSAWVLGNMTILITQADESTRRFRVKFKNLERYMESNIFPSDIEDSLKSYLILQFNAAKEHREIMDEFPAVFRTKVNRLLYRPVIDCSLFAQVGSDAFLDSLSCVLTLEVLMPGTDAVSQNDASFEMFLMVSGSADVLLDNILDYGSDDEDEALEDKDLSAVESLNINNDNEIIEVNRRRSNDKINVTSNPYANLKSKETIKKNKKKEKLSSFNNFTNWMGINKLEDKDNNKDNNNNHSVAVSSIGKSDSFGEISFFYNLLQPFTVRTTSICRLLVLKRENWEMLKSVYPQDARLIQYEVARNLKEAYDDYAALSSTSTVNEGTSTSELNTDGNIKSINNNDSSGKTLHRLFGSMNELTNSTDDLIKLNAPITSSRIRLSSHDQKSHESLQELDHSTSRSKNRKRASSQTEDSNNTIEIPRRKSASSINSINMKKITSHSERKKMITIVMKDIYGAMLDAVNSSLVNMEQDQVAALCLAATTGNTFALRQLTYGGFDVNTSDYDNRTALHIAAAKGKTESIEFLLSKFANPNCLDSFGVTPLFEAVRNGHDKAAAIIYKSGGRLGFAEEKKKQKIKDHTQSNATDNFNNVQSDPGSLMCLAVTRGDVTFLERLIIFGLSPDSSDYDGRTGLHLAASEGYTDIIECLLKHGAFPSPLDKFGHTPLLEAVRSQQEPSARKLFKHGGEFRFKLTSVVRSGAESRVQSIPTTSRRKSTVLQAIDVGTLEIENNSPSDIRMVNVRSCLIAGLELCLATHEKDLNYLKLLLEFGCPVNATDYDSRTAAHVCCAENSISAALILFEYKADFTSTRVRDRWGRTPLDEAIYHNHVQLAETIKSLIELASSEATKQVFDI